MFSSGKSCVSQLTQAEGKCHMISFICKVKIVPTQIFVISLWSGRSKFSHFTEMSSLTAQYIVII